MSGLVSGVGLFSGLPVGEIIDQLMAIQARPLGRVQARVAELQGERAAYADLSARLLALKGAASRFDQAGFFRSAVAGSSRPDILRARAGEGALPGTYRLHVHALVSAHQLISRGHADPDLTPVGRGTIAIEVGDGHVAPAMFLDDIGGPAGVGRGVIEIQDQSGRTARLDLRAALTLDEVLAAINTEPLIEVTARVAGDRLALADHSGGSGALVVRDISGTLADDLGLSASLGAAQGQTLLGADLRDVDNDTLLGALNDGSGVRRNTVGPDLVFTSGAQTIFEVELNERLEPATHLAMLNGGAGVELGRLRIETANGAEFEVDLSGEHSFSGEPDTREAATVGDVVELLNAAAPAAEYTVQVDLNASQLVVTDHTPGSGELNITDLDGTSAADLGLTQSAQDGVLRGAEVYHVRTVGDVLRAINYAADNYDLASGNRLIEARLSGSGIDLVSTGGDFAIEPGQSGQRVSGAAEDLGIMGSSQGGVLESRRLLAGLGSVLLRSLNGGLGTELGVVAITARDGTAFQVDLSAPDQDGLVPESLSEIIDRLNAAAESSGAAVRAAVNRAGNGLALLDDGAGDGDLLVSDTPAARSLGLVAAVAPAAGRLEGANLQRQYVALTTLLDSLNAGGGAGTGTFEIRASSGATIRIDVTSNQETVGDLLDVINVRTLGTGVTAELNETGDGLVIRDRSAGSQSLQINDRSGHVARSLRLLGAAESRTVLTDDPDDPGQMIEVDEHFVDGRFETLITIDGDDTLRDIAEKVNAADGGVVATVINDGSGRTPYRLGVTSAFTGSAGRMVFDTGSTGLDLDTLVQPRDAAVSYGGSEAAPGVLIRSSTNSLAEVIDQVTIDLVSASPDAVELTVAPDVDGLVQALQGFVAKYNEVIDRIEQLTFFNAETFETGPLRDDPAIGQVENRLRAIFSAEVDTGDPGLRRFADIGITFAAGAAQVVDGVTVAAGRDGTITFDEARFLEAFAQSPEAVLALFTQFEIVDLAEEGAAGSTPLIDPQTGEVRQEFRGLGLGFQIEEVLDLLTRSGDGVLARREAALRAQEQLFDQRSAAIQALLATRRARLERQFARLEETIAALASQQSSLSALQQYLLGGIGQN